MTTPWREYQERAAAFFRDLGLSASTDVKLKGVRTVHDVDVLVEGEFAGFSNLWIVECKHWQRPVNKAHVLTLREIVSDLGADRGILLAESGFQSGALEAARLTNVELTSLSELSERAEADVYAMRLLADYDRVQECRSRYWALDQRKRIRAGLRPERGVSGYSANLAIKLCDDLLKQAMRGAYPVFTDELYVRLSMMPDSFEDPATLSRAVITVIEEVERLLAVAEAIRD